METGQLFMPEVPAGATAVAAVSASAVAGSAGAVEASPFAGMLAGLATQGSAAKESAPANTGVNRSFAVTGAVGSTMEIALPLVEQLVSLVPDAGRNGTEPVRTVEQDPSGNRFELEQPEVLMTQE